MNKTGGGLTLVGKDQEEKLIIEEILIKHLDSIYSTALRLTKNKEKAEDLVQDACLRAIKYCEQLRSNDKVKAWLFKILTNTFINKYRKMIKEPPLVEIELSESLLESASALYRHSSNPEEILIKSSLDEEIKEALDNLHVDLRVVLWLSDVEGFTYQEIGEMLECPMGTIASRLYRGRSLLREALWEYAKKRGVI
ncbi:MAG TPA: sigma-70 family RNA polymerase sigma factor [Thermodesulfobacteriota bacterium]|nr:sigma-70 family RNA polymerase sigma factor [Thermodesulfobacteriota bacterium]